MELLPKFLVFRGHGCEHLSYLTQLMRDGHQSLDELREEGDDGVREREGAGQRFGAEIGEVLVAEAEGTPCLSELSCHEVEGLVN